MIRTLALSASATLLLALPAASQGCPVHWSPEFGVTGATGTAPEVNAFEVFDDGTGEALFVGGLFTGMDGTPGLNVIRWRGLFWTPVGAGLAGRVRTLFVHDDGTGSALYAGGDFAGNVARWNGTTWQFLTGSPNGPVHVLGSYNDGLGNAIYAGGLFTVAGGTQAKNVARWKNGSWSGVGLGLNGKVEAFAVYNDGTGARLYAGGEFITSGASTVLRIAAWNGSTWQSVAGGFNLPVRALGVHTDLSGTRLYAGGDFSFSNGVPVASVARLLGATWGPVGTGLPGPVLSFTAHDDGSGFQLYAGGKFTGAGGAQARIARWDGLAWNDVGSGLDDECRALIEWAPGLASGAGLYAGGIFTRAGGFSSRAIARWDDDQSAPTRYCTAKVNSLGCTTSIGFSGAPSTTAGSGFVITASQLLGNHLGILFYGKSGADAVPFQGGTLCVKPPTLRTAVQNSGGGAGCSGTFGMDFNAYIATGVDPALVPGASVWCQYWSRDTGFPPAQASNLTDGLQFFLCQ